MGRWAKPLKNKKVIDKRELGYYSTPSFVAEFISNIMLQINPKGKFALDPAVGNEELLPILHQRKIKIDGVDIYDHTNHQYCTFLKADFIDIYRKKKSGLIFGENIDLKYDYYIANPPFNDHEVTYIKENKKELSKLFPAIGFDNMSSMFISAMIDCAKEGALIGFISADGFLTGKSYQPLREQILKSCSIHHLILCPVDLFYEQKSKVRTCIMILQKGTQYQRKVKILNRPNNKEELEIKLKNQSFKLTELKSIISKSSKNEFEFVVGIPTEIQSLFSLPKVGEVYKCISGISTGNDELYISKEERQGFDIPFYHNPHANKFFCEPNGFLTNDYLKIEKKNKTFIVRNKTFLLKEGITCSRIGLPFSACYMPKDSAYGVNPNIFCPKKDIWWLMAFLNSSLVTYIVKGVLNRSNSLTSGYVAKIPLVKLDQRTKKKLETIARSAYGKRIPPKELGPVINEIDRLIFKKLGFSKATETEIVYFASHLNKRV